MRFRMLKILSFLSLLLFFLAPNTYGQTSISGIINVYAPVTSINTSCNSVTLTGVTGFGIGDKVLLIQMKGASVNGTNTANFGNITNIGEAGNYEFNEILDIQGTVVYFRYTLLKSYTAVALQLISVPQYNDVIISGTLTARPWDGSTGGVLVFEASGNVEFNADINVEGLGFRGGVINAGSTNSCAWGAGNFLSPTIYSTSLGTNGYAGKGEGISQYITNMEVGRGHQANAGGGGHSSNTGGGGGANYGMGGIGGRQSRPSNGNTGCRNTVGGKGMPGTSLASYYTSGKVFMGGGGGGGQQNNYTAPGPPHQAGATPGNPGGGIVIIQASSITGNAHTIYAGGYNEKSLNRTSLGGYTIGATGYVNHFPDGSKKSYGDSGGGGGGGGTVLLSTASGYSNSLTVDVRGGRGDTVFTEVEIDLGPGGGGGGGVVWVNDASLDPNLTADVSAGVSGISWNLNVPSVCQCRFEAEDGQNGATLYNLTLPESTTPFSPCTTVPVRLLHFGAKEVNRKIDLRWATATELNNDFFVLEKSADGIQYEYLASVKGNGTSSQTISYSYTDYSPYIGLNYYRLKQYDFDGQEHTGGHASVTFLGSGELIEKIYPNPFRDEMIIQPVTPLHKEETEITLSGILGNDLYAITPSFEKEGIFINTSSLAKGVYILQIFNQGKVETRKVIKE